MRATSTDALYFAFLKGAVAAVGDSGVVTSLRAAASPTATLGDYDDSVYYYEGTEDLCFTV